jgi:hypothetical protein
MKYLIVAHGDDECLLGDPEWADKIIIVFTERSDVKGFGDRRKKALEQHPLKDKIDLVELEESNWWRQPTEKNKEKLIDNYYDLCDYLKELWLDDEDEIKTHNAWGEYGHADHKLVHKAVMNTVNCKVNGQDPELYREIRDCYVRNGVWTWALVDGLP